MVNEFKGFSGIQMIDEGAAEAASVVKQTAFPAIAPVAEPLLQPTDPSTVEPGDGGGAVNKVVIVGSGPAGLTAAIYAARANLEPLVIAGAVPGGQLMLTSDVENYPGFPDGIQGPELMDLFRQQAARFGTRFVDKDIERVDFSQRPFRLWAGGVGYGAEAVIIATGASAIWLGLDSETRLRGRGVSACATCDGFFFRDKHVAVVGGGDSALEEATFLTKFASRVTMIHRRDEFRGSKIMRDRALKDPKVDVRWNSEVAEVLGDDVVSGLALRDTQTGEIHEEPMDGLFIAIGHTPNTDVFRDWLEVDPKGYLVVHDQTGTKVEGVFVAGDVHDHRYRQAITAAGDGCRAAIDAERWLESVGLTEAATSTAW
jgi:thioredoxin reductase (NADPH)